MKVAGTPPDDPAMAAARARIHARGGPPQADVFTKILLALFGEYDWAGVPSMPVEIMLLPRWSYFNLLEVSYWSRTVIVPLLIVMDRKPVKRLGGAPAARRALGGAARAGERSAWTGSRGPSRRKTFLWKNFFIGVDDYLKSWERLGPRPFRARAVDAARRWIEERLAVPGGLGGIFPAMTNAVLALESPRAIRTTTRSSAGQIKEIENLGVETAHTLYYQPCLSPVWDTALAANALVESGLPADHPQLQRAADWMMNEQITVPGDWQVQAPPRPGGRMAVSVQQRLLPRPGRHGHGHDGADEDPGGGSGAQAARDRARAPSGSSGCRDRTAAGRRSTPTTTASSSTTFPFADHGALLDPSTEDLTGRGLELLGTLGYGTDHPAAQRALGFIQRTQAKDGSWYGRWGANYIYGTWSVLRGLGGHRRGLLAGATCSVAVAWLVSRQNPDGGWGETLASYDDPELAGRGDSMPSQTAWALLGLFAAGHTEGAAVDSGDPVPDPHPARGRRLGGPALEWHRFPARLLPEVPPLRQVLPALGPRRVPEQAAMTPPETTSDWPLPARALEVARTRHPRGRRIAGALRPLPGPGDHLHLRPAVQARSPGGPDQLLRLEVAHHRAADRRLHRDGAEPAGLPHAGESRLGGVRRARGRDLAHPRAGTGAVRRLRDRPGRLRASRPRSGSCGSPSRSTR